MKIYRSLFLGFMILALLGLPAGTASAGSAVLAPLSIKNTSGKSVGGVSTLGAVDQVFVRFTTPSKNYSGYRTYVLPDSMPRDSVSTLKLKVTYYGLPAASQTWTWYAYKWSTASWTKLGTNNGAKKNIWKTFTFNVPSPKAYVNNAGSIRILLQSNNASGDARIDYEGVVTTTAFTLQNAPNIPNTCPMFLADNFWNTRVDGLDPHASSADWIDSIGRNRGFHMDFGSGIWDGGPIGIPYNVVAGSQVPQYDVDFYYPDESDPGPYPIPLGAEREWGGDHHILVVDTETCTLYETYDMSFAGGQWSGGSGAVWDMNSNEIHPDGWTSADAAGLPILPGLLRYQEIEAALLESNPADRVIHHALRFTVPCSPDDTYLWPATHHAGSGSCSDPVPFGARFRLNAGYNISGFSSELQVILRTMKMYGIVNADNGSAWYVSGAPDERWDNDLLHDLDVLTGNNFEAVDTACMMVSANSAAASLASCP